MRFLVPLLLLLVTGCSTMDKVFTGQKSPGHLEVNTSMYDKSSMVHLVAAPLFDAKDSPSELRLGFYWETKMDDKVYFIISMPVDDISEYDKVSKRLSNLYIDVDNHKRMLKKARNAVSINEKDYLITKKYEAKIRFVGSRDLLKIMLAGNNVTLKVKVPGKVYQGRFDLMSAKRDKYKKTKSIAYNSAERFVVAVSKARQ